MMLLQGIIKGFVDNVDTKLEPKYISIEQATPRAIACFLFGYQLYYRFVDHEVRKSMAIHNKSERVYADLLINSKKSMISLEKILITGGVLSSIYASYETKNPLFILGGSLMVGTAIFDYFNLKKITTDLEKLKFEEKLKVPENQMMHITQKRFSLIEKWKSKYIWKIVLSLAAILTFYIAELSQSEKVNLKFTLKK